MRGYGSGSGAHGVVAAAKSDGEPAEALQAGDTRSARGPHYPRGRVERVRNSIRSGTGRIEGIGSRLSGPQSSRDRNNDSGGANLRPRRDFGSHRSFGAQPGHSLRPSSGGQSAAAGGTLAGRL